MKTISRVVLLTAVALGAVVVGHRVINSPRNGFAGAFAAESRPTSPIAGNEVTGVVSRVSDGDTIWVTDANGLRHKIRMLDIDAPESSQKFGSESTARLKSLIGGKSVRVTYSERDKYDRLLGTVWLGDEDINFRMVNEGMAWRYHYSKNGRYAAAQSAAKAKRAGLWADPKAQDPWAYRRGQMPQRGPGGESAAKVAKPQTGTGSTQVPVGYFSGSRVEYRAGNTMPVGSRTPAPVCDKWPDTGWWLSTNSMKRHNRKCENYRKTRGYPCRKDEGSPCGKCGG